MTEYNLPNTLQKGMDPVSQYPKQILYPTLSSTGTPLGHSLDLNPAIERSMVLPHRKDATQWRRVAEERCFSEEAKYVLFQR